MTILLSSLANTSWGRAAACPCPMAILMTDHHFQHQPAGAGMSAGGSR